MHAPCEASIQYTVLLASRPAPALRHLIRHYYQVQDFLVGCVSLQPVPARSPQILEFMFGTRYQVHRMDRDTTECVRAVALVGARTCRSAELILSGAVDAFTIVFQPGAFSTCSNFRQLNSPTRTSMAKKYLAAASANSMRDWVRSQPSMIVFASPIAG